MVYENFPGERLAGLSGLEGNTSPTGLRNDDIIFEEFPDFITGCVNTLVDA
jgi:hypothetical protein